MSSTIEDIKNYLLKTNLIETCVKYQSRGYYSAEEQEDIIQETWLWILTYDNEKLFAAFETGHLNALITRYLQNQIRSVNGQYYRREVTGWRNKKANIEGFDCIDE